MHEQAETIESIVLRESVRARVAAAPFSILGTISCILLFMPFLLSQGVSHGRIALWVIPIVVFVLARVVYSRAIDPRIDDLAVQALSSADRLLRYSSILNQFTIGTGIWIIQSPTADPHVLPLFMTLIVVIFSIGVMANLFSDFRSFAISVPLLVGQPAIFWITRDDIGIAIGIGMLLATALMIILIRRGSSIFKDSVLMRFQKDWLLQSVEEEKEKTLTALMEAEEANESRAFFMAAASHDVKQPLFALAMLTDTLLMSDISESVREILHKQRANISWLSQHFDALMDLSKFEGGIFEINYSSVQLTELRMRIDEEFAPQCQEKGLEWQIQMDSVELTTDVELLLRLLRNLLGNAIRYTQQGVVRCEATVAANKLEFSITDTGPGIAEADQKLVFKQFVRLENSGQEKTGAGLGLAIVDHIDAVLNLGLQMNSVVGEGTRFRFSVNL